MFQRLPHTGHGMIVRSPPSRTFRAGEGQLQHTQRRQARALQAFGPMACYLGLARALRDGSSRRPGFPKLDCF